MEPDGTIILHLRAQLGYESKLPLDVSGKNLVVDKYHSPEITFPSGDRLGIKLANNNELIAPTFWYYSFPHRKHS